jgi:hypothetical protein
MNVLMRYTARGKNHFTLQHPRKEQYFYAWYMEDGTAHPKASLTTGKQVSMLHA